jgi:hypothetical protein
MYERIQQSFKKQGLKFGKIDRLMLLVKYSNL